MLADLHVHTHFSDGTFSPQQVVNQAVKSGLCAIAITDHDCVDGIEPSITAAKDTGLEIIPGIEMTSEMDGCEIHILGYFIDYKQKHLVEELQALVRLRNKRMQRMLECLLRFGISVSMEEVRDVGAEGSLGRLHLATLLFNKGHVKTIQEAFDRFLGNGKPCYVKGDRLNPIDAISIIAKAGGVPVLAHPYIMGRDEFIPTFVKAGLKGIEVYHTDHPDNASRHYKGLAGRFGLIITGGSDCHGMGKGRILMGSVTVPYDVVEKLKNAR